VGKQEGGRDAKLLLVLINLWVQLQALYSLEFPIYKACMKEKW
jgi:hypothetical protein